MKFNYFKPLPAFFLIITALIMLMVQPVTAPAPGTTGWTPSWTTQVGCGEFDSGKMQVIVMDPNKLSQFGLSVQKGDQIKIKVMGDNAFKLLNVRTGKAVSVVAEKNKLKPLKQ